MSPLVLALTLLVGCGEDEKAARPAAEATAPKPQAPSPQKQLEEARKQALAGKHEEALALAEKVLARKPEEDGVWRLLEQEGLAAGARGLLERLDAAKAVGGRVGPHFLLRAELALAANMPADALTAAKLAAEAEPDAAATLLARAALALGDPAGAAEPLPEAALALVAWAKAPDAGSAAPLSEAAKKVGGWRAALFRGSRNEARGELEAALAEYAAAAADADPRARVSGNLARARLAASRPEAKVGADQSGGWAAEAAKAALAEGDGRATLEAMDLAVRVLIGGGRADDALARAREVLGGLPQGVEPALAGRIGLAVALAAQSAGLPGEAREAAAKAREQLAEDPEAAASAAWIEGFSAYQLGRADEVAEAAGRCAGARAEALAGLAAFAKGDLATAASAFPTAGLQPREGALAWVEAARADAAEATAWLDRAVEAADQSGELSLRVSTRLARESALRASGAKAAASTRAQLAALAPEGAAGDPLRAELAARTLLEGGKASFPAMTTLPAAVGAWAALSAGAAPPPAGDDPLASGATGWAEGRAAAANGKGDAIFPAWSAALGKLPNHRQGALSLGTVLDGSEGLPVDQDAALLTAMGEAAPIDAWFAVHEVSHRAARFRREAAAGLDYAASLAPDKREPLQAALARARAGVSTWLAGQAPYPKEALAAVITAEAGLASADGFGAVLPVVLAAPTEQLESLGGLAIVSFRVSGGQVHGVALSKRGQAARGLGGASKLLSAASQLRATLEAGAVGGGSSPVAAGDRLRQALLDPFADVLSGVGRYLVLAPEPLDAFPLTALPEQSSGLRWLADIRSVGLVPTLSTLALPSHPVETYNPDFLGLGKSGASIGAPATTPAEGATPAPEDLALPPSVPMTDELAASARVFPAGLKQVEVGDKVTLKLWGERSRSARYIHFTGLAAAPDGGFVLADGPLTLSRIRSTPLAAYLVVISAQAPMAVQRLRAQAFLDAGARAVLLSAWPIPDQARSRFFGAYYEAIARDRTPARALSEARETFLGDTLAGVGMAEPAMWGSFLLVGAP